MKVVRECKGIILLIIIFSLVMCHGCATSKVATSMGVAIGDSFKEAAEKGTVSATETIRAWPYISGLLKGLTGEEYDYRLTQSMRDVINNLDQLAKKEKLTDQEKGLVIGYMVRLEFLSGQEFWNKYGVSLLGSVKSFMVGG